MLLQLGKKPIPTFADDSRIHKERLQYFLLLLISSMIMIGILGTRDFRAGSQIMAAFHGSVMVLMLLSGLLLFKRKEEIAYILSVVAAMALFKIAMMIDIIYDISTTEQGSLLFPLALMVLAIGGLLAFKLYLLLLCNSMVLIAASIDFTIRMSHHFISLPDLLSRSFILLLTSAVSVSIFFIIRYADKAEQKASQLANDRQVLLKELNHRVKNNLQVVSSMLNIQLRHIEDSEGAAAIRDSRDRIYTMALVHRKFTDNEDLGSINVRSFITDLVEKVISSSSLDSKKIRSTVDVPEITSSPEILVPLGLILNELLINTVRHGLSENDEPEITVSLHEDHRGKVYRFEVKDNGAGGSNPLLFPNRTSLGVSIIQAFAVQLDAKLEFHKEAGMRVTLSFDSELFKVSRQSKLRLESAQGQINMTQGPLQSR